jgi:hypothetical protein
MGVNRRVDLRRQLSPEQQAAIKKDTRLVGEIACSYGVSAAIILKVQRKRPRKEHRRVDGGKVSWPSA